MTQGSGYHNRQGTICSKISSLLVSIGSEPSKYDQIAPKIEYWIEYVLREGFATVDELVEGVSGVGWDGVQGTHTGVGRFLKEFYDAPHRSKQARSFVSQMCPHALRWFAVASTEDLWSYNSSGSVSNNGSSGFISAAAFIGHLVEWGLLTHELVRRHLIKPLTNHHDKDNNLSAPGATRAKAVYQLFVAAGNTLLQGLLEPEDVQECFNMLNARNYGNMGFITEKIQEFRDIHAAWIERKEEQKESGETEEPQSGGEDVVTAETSGEAKTPVAFPPQDLPIAGMGIEIPSSILQDIESSSIFSDGDSSLETFIDVPSGAVSPTLSISTVSDLTPTEFGEEVERGERQTAARHDTLYFEDGNVEIACGDTIFRVHSSIVSFSSSELRKVLSQPALLDAPTPEGRPRITTSDSAEDFAILLKMIYTPGFPARHKIPEFNVFAPLLCMTTKYGFSDVRDQLIEEVKGAYPTKWEDFINARVLGEGVFGSPKPHPNAVLNLFEAQGIRFAIPFAAYRASIDGFHALISDKPGTALSRRTLASTVQGMHVLSTLVSNVARVTTYGAYPSVCPEKTCALNVGLSPAETRIKALEKVYLAMIDNREGGLLSPPSLKHLLCTRCAGRMEAGYAKYGSLFWENLPPVFNLSRGWDGL